MKIHIKSNNEVSLKWSMMRTLILCWVLPFTLLTIIVIEFVYHNLNQQTEQTIVNSTEKAVEICLSRMQDSIIASKNASYLPTIRERYNQYLLDNNYLVLYEKVTLFLTQQYKFDDRLLSTMLIFTDNPNDVYYTYSNKYKSTYSNVQYFKRNVLAKVIEISKDLDTKVKFLPFDDRVYMVRNLMTPNFEPYAVIAMELNNETVFESISTIWGYEAGTIYKNGSFLWGSKENEYLTRYDDITNQSVYYKNEKGSYVYKTLKYNQDVLTFVAKLDSEVILYEMDALRYIVTLSIPLLIAFALIVFRFFHRKITKPIVQLISASHKIEDGDYGTQIQIIEGSQEFSFLSEAFNSMSLKLKYQFEQIYLEELALKDARIMALQSQINPHFLNNTLEIINWEARLMENYKVSGMIEALSTILGATMNRKHQQHIPLAEELSYADAYFFIISTRLGERFQVVKEIDESLLQVPVPRLIIQPIIENAVEHGMNAQNQGVVTLHIFSEEDKLFIEVRNQGELTVRDKERIDALLSDDYDAENERSTSLGIRNVNRRLKIIYGSDCGLSIKSDKDGSTVSTIIVKLNKTNSDK
ncbi:histidine kinase [Lachnoclostridium sp.]|nr:histidine kinase [Lachnoclostridium sp.]